MQAGVGALILVLAPDRLKGAPCKSKFLPEFDDDMKAVLAVGKQLAGEVYFKEEESFRASRKAQRARAAEARAAEAGQQLQIKSEPTERTELEDFYDNPEKAAPLQRRVSTKPKEIYKPSVSVPKQRAASASHSNASAKAPAKVSASKSKGQTNKSKVALRWSDAQQFAYYKYSPDLLV